MKRILILLCVLSLKLHAQSITLSDDAKISVITCGPWQGELYSAFGHSAFRVYDPANNLDDAYNYGLFDFDQPNFYLNFARGFLYYKLGVQHYPDFQNSYVYFNRSVHEQELNLTQEQKQKIFDYLQWNALPENENYRYDYFYNNCATKIRDVVVTVLGDSVQFDGSYVTTDYTIRDLTDIYLVHQPWGDLGIDICLGLPMDKKASPFEYMFLPDYIESGFAHATIKQNGALVPIVKQRNVVYESRYEQAPSGLPHPHYVFDAVAIIFIVISFIEWRKKKFIAQWPDILLFLSTGLIGWLLLFLWVATDHAAAANNFNILWALPTNLIAAIAFIWQPRWLGKYFLAVAIIAVLTLLLWPVLPQDLNYSLIPIVITIAVRAFLRYWLAR